MIIDLKRHAVYRAVFYPVERRHTWVTRGGKKKKEAADGCPKPPLPLASNPAPMHIQVKQCVLPNI
jgi:hypothetical protein